MWKGSEPCSASSERGSPKADGGRGPGQENMESSLSLKSIARSDGRDTRVRGRSHRVTMETGLSTTARGACRVNVLTFLSDVQVQL